ncbi:GDSL-type esterase/lipase family protein [Methyloferula stellata]|uniref:GDSL-type esterase/lipase family protein n=1 Tax=Methyloferula stellata TaxID=876270 RepID=UPI0009FBF89F|nr:GDSL-type esterase/lipase family protein [Methyloferula stellata]
MKKMAWMSAILAIAVMGFVGARQVHPSNDVWFLPKRHIPTYDPLSDQLYIKMTQLFAQEAAKSVVMLGDSLTESANWPTLLQYPDVANRGISGDTSVGVLQRLQDSVKSAKIVFLLIGINDQFRFIPETETQRNIAKIVDELGKTSKVVVQSVLLTRDKKINAYVMDMDRFEKGLCETGKCKYVDLNAGLSENGLLKESFARDNIHINADGYAAWASIIKPILDQELHASLRRDLSFQTGEFVNSGADDRHPAR